MSNHLRIGAGVLSTALLLVAMVMSCRQGQGDRCQFDDDCEDGLICCVLPESRELGGECQPENKCDQTPAVDSGNGDSSADDGGADAPPASDDMGQDKGADEDSAPPDATTQADTGGDMAQALEASALDAQPDA